MGQSHDPLLRGCVFASRATGSILSLQPHTHSQSVPLSHSCFPSHSLSVTPSLLSSSCDLVCRAQQLADLSPLLRRACSGGDPARLGTWSYGDDGSAAQQPEGTEARQPQPSPSLPAQGSGRMGGFVLSGCRSVEISRIWPGRLRALPPPEAGLDPRTGREVREHPLPDATFDGGLALW
ncbi:hypothetical protein QQF64_014782 [Cirrhinus molitorella]|uniref:Uncharacterized protein n=1 Tax=Cirrhinus molitorella TaxID=172907 RepID=A0ABR3NTS6_9TELE